MFHSPDFYPNPGSYDDVLKRMTRRMQQHRVHNQIFEILQQVFEKELVTAHDFLYDTVL